ncbi:MAG TPA: hypothetical protein VLI04_19375 [Nocardioidaceae bacterium]|nr:hypothetical protein [Nocardioidaceae bacterium]
MKNKRTMTAATAIATASSLLMLPGSTAQASAARQAQVCNAIVTGIDTQQRVRQLEVDSSTITTDRASSPLKFRGYQQGIVAARETDAGFVIFTRVVTRDGRPRTLEIRTKDADTERLTVDATSFAMDDFEPVLFTASFSGPEAYAFGGGKLARVTTYRKSNGGGLYFDDRVVLKSGLRLKSIAYVGRPKINGVATDIMFATTTRGALLHLRVPVKNPRNLRIKVVKRTGFRRYSALATASCGNGFGLLAVDKGQLAHMFSVGHVLNPSAGDVRKQYRVAADFNWPLLALV